MPLEEEEEVQVRQILTGMCLNKYQADKFISTLNRMLAICPVRRGTNVLTQEKGEDQVRVAVWRIYMPDTPPVPPPPGGSTAPVIPINRTLRMAA